MQNQLLQRTTTITIKNDPIPITMKNIKKYFSYAYVLTKIDNNPLPAEFYGNTVNVSLYNSTCDRLILKQVSLDIFKNKLHFTNMNIMSDIQLERFNKLCYTLDTNNLVITILNSSLIKLETYLLQYTSNTTLKNIYNIIIFNKYFQVKKMKLDYLIQNMYESNFWNDDKIDIGINSSRFDKRVFRIDKTIIVNEDAKKALENVDDYINLSGYSYMNITDNMFKSSYIIYPDMLFTKEDIYNIFNALDTKDRYFLFCYMLITKNYCHMILNNEKLLILMKPIINKYINLFRYLIGYAWSLFYLNESFKKTKLKTTDSIVFDINTASQLPIFPFSHEFPKFNPYSTLFINNTSLKGDTCVGGIKQIIHYHKGITNLEEFKKNLNMFTTGNKNNNLFHGIEFGDNIALTGSIMTACIQNIHPLEYNFNGTNDEKKQKYYDEYYSNADIDMMIKTNDIKEYFKIVNKIYRQICINVCDLNPQNAKPYHIKLILNKKCNFFVSKRIIDTIEIKHIDNNLNKVEYIKTNINNDINIKKYFMDMYGDMVIKPMVDNIDDYPELFDDNINFTVSINNNESDMVKAVMNYKYSISSPHLIHNLEIFQVRSDDFFATVSKFHLPCVRAYYNGNVYMTPSFITSHMTFMNIDYKYFAGCRDPIEIINKYRLRGFGTWLSGLEKKQYYAYSNKIPFWAQSLGSVNNIIKSGPIKISDIFYRPRLYQETYYINNNPVDLDTRYSDELINTKEYKTQTDMCDFMYKEYKELQTPLDIHINNCNAISVMNSMCPLQIWLISAVYGIINEI